MVVVAPMVVPLVVAPLAMVSLVPAPAVMAPMMLHMPSLGPVMVLGPRPTLSPPLVMVSHVQVPAILQVMAMRWGSAHMQTPLLQVVMAIVNQPAPRLGPMVVHALADNASVGQLIHTG